MSQPGFPQRPGQRPAQQWGGGPGFTPPRQGFPQQGFPQQGFPQQGFPQQRFPQQGPPPGQMQQPPPGWRPNPQGWQPSPQGWQQAPQGWQPPMQPRAQQQKRSRSPLPFLAVGALVLVGLLAFSFLSSTGEEEVAADYENEDYAVPSTNNKVSEIPIPQYEEEVPEWLEANSLYSQQLASPVRCEVTSIPVQNTLSDSELQTRMSAYVECLTRVWGPALEAAGFEAYQPTLFVYPAGDTVTTSCGTQESLNAFYCGADQNLYLASDILRILPQSEADAPEAFDLIIAHEYGHAMQGRSGVFTASYFAGEDAGSESEALEISRKVELQADCYAGAVIDSVSESMGLTDAARDAIARISYEIGDDRIAERFEVDFEEGDHGLGENRELWANKGLTGGPLSVCNTFTAPGPEVR